MSRRERRERGAALVEFALVSFVLYLLLAGTIEFGRMMFDANALQDVARAAARELSLAPIPAASTFDFALACDPDSDGTTACPVNLRARIFDPACLVIDVTDPAVAPDPNAFYAALPIVNRALIPLMITEPQRPNLMRYAGALLSDGSGTACSAVGPNGQAAATGLTVGIPLVTARDPSGAESITWVPVVQEIRADADADCPQRGPFSLIYQPTQDACGALTTDPMPDRGIAAVRINYPYQAATLSAFRSAATDTDPLPPNIGNFISANDGSVQQNNEATGSGVDDGSTPGPYAGQYGLGYQYALAGQVVRPFRKLLSAQAIFRREVVE